MESRASHLSTVFLTGFPDGAFIRFGGHGKLLKRVLLLAHGLIQGLEHIAQLAPLPALPTVARHQCLTGFALWPG